MKITVSAKWLIDALERIVFTFLAAFASALLLSSQTTAIGLSTLHSALLAGVAAGLTTLKTIVAANVGSPDSAALLPSPSTASSPVAPAANSAPVAAQAVARLS
jgi:hypothetical protein